MEELIHITATYSNALLVAILPHISDCAKKLDLPIAKPIAMEHVLRFNPNRYKGHLSGTVVLTNHYWFAFDERGYVNSFTSPTNWFSGDEDIVDNPQRYTGKTQMTTNEIVAFARANLIKLGYPPELTHADTTPEVHGPYELNQGGHVPYCRILWEPVKDSDAESYSKVRIEINTQDKTVVGMYLDFGRSNKVGTPLKLDVKPETQSEFRQRTKATMFIRSNASPLLPQSVSPPP